MAILIEPKSRKRGDLIGALVEIDLGEYFVYGLCTHHRDVDGHLLRMVPGTYKTRPEHPEILTESPAFCHAFFPLKYALKQPEVELLGFVELDQSLLEFPTLRGGGERYQDQMSKAWVHGPWNIVDGSGRVQHVPDDFPGLEQLSSKGIHNLASLKAIYDHNLTPERRYQIAMGTLELKPKQAH